MWCKHFGCIWTVLLTAATVSGVHRGFLYPYGRGVPDKILPPQDDVSSPEIFLKTPIVYFDEIYHSVYVSISISSSLLWPPGQLMIFSINVRTLFFPGKWREFMRSVSAIITWSFYLVSFRSSSQKPWLMRTLRTMDNRNCFLFKCWTF